MKIRLYIATLILASLLLPACLWSSFHLKGEIDAEETKVEEAESR